MHRCWVWVSVTLVGPKSTPPCSLLLQPVILTRASASATASLSFLRAPCLPPAACRLPCYSYLSSL